MPLISRREDLEMLILLSLLFYQQICFAFEYTDELRMLANRVAQLERTIGKEQQNSVHGEFQSVNLELKSDIPHPDFSRTDKPRIQETELHIPGKGTNDSKLKTCDDRIQALERTVRELSKLFKVQENDIQHIHNLEARLDEQEKIISYLRKHISENEINIQTIQNEEMIPKGIEIKESDASLPNETGISKIQRIKEKNSPSVANINKKRLLSPVTTTPYPSYMSNPIAFYAYMSKNTPTVTIQHPLSFDVVKTNFGNGYHSTTGVFMVPESGVYVFTWTIRIGDNNHHSTQLMVNTDELGIIYSHVASDSDVGGTGIVVAHVDKGDDVYVRTHASWNSGAIYSTTAGRSSFAGWKLF
ncbi:uncharacterized protein LOC134257863 [Saccostrea cucullata]|uniref:uncharacterized protein LOC134257863 n=1 Tax=Saccostrea cuccullata TaxID=36930 RepID=UPI002ED11F42